MNRMNKRILACTGWMMICLLLGSTLAFAEESGVSATEASNTTSTTVTTLPTQEESMSPGEDLDPTQSTQNSQNTQSSQSTKSTKSTTKKSTTKKTTTRANTYGTTYNAATHTLTVKAGANGTVDTTVNGKYRNQTKIILKATAAEGYVFDKWVSTDGVLLDAYSAQTEFYMPGSNATVTASFVKKTAATDSNGATISQQTTANASLQSWQIAAIIAAILVAAVIAVQCVLLWKDHVRLGHADQSDQ